MEPIRTSSAFDKALAAREAIMAAFARKQEFEPTNGTVAERLRPIVLLSAPIRMLAAAQQNIDLGAAPGQRARDGLGQTVDIQA